MLIATVMGDNGLRFMDMCFESILDADKIIFLWGMQDLETKNKFLEWQKRFPSKFELIEFYYNQEDKSQNGKSRNFYLNHLKTHYPSDWNLSLDLDEVVENLMYIKEYIQTAKPGLYSIHMRHFHLDLGHEDSSQEKHWVYNRLFKISEAYYYPEVEHPVLQPIVKGWSEIFKGETTIRHPKEVAHVGQTDCTTIWHLAHINHCFSIKKRYEKNLSHSNMHSKEFLDAWNKAHILGFYPNKPIDPKEIPEVILKYFNIDKDEIYFQSRHLELKNLVMVKQWAEYFKPQSLLDLGCGRGPYLYIWEMIVPGKVEGYELSSYAVKNSFTDKVKQKDISEDWDLSFYEGKQGRQMVQLPPFDLITMVDVLEHLTDEKLDKTLKNAYKYGNKFLFSMPFKGENGQADDPNLAADRTHLQHRTKTGWIKLLEGHGFKISDPPEHFLFKNQILIGSKE